MDYAFCPIKMLKELAEWFKPFGDLLLVLITGLLALYTYKLFKATRELATDANKSSARQVSVAAWIELSKRWNSPEMLKSRTVLASRVCVDAQFLTVNPKTHKAELSKPASLGEYPEPILNFFEDLAIVRKLKLIDEDLAANSFGYYARRWWIILEPYVKYVQGTDAGGKTVFGGFEKYANEIEDGYKVKLTKDNIEDFRYSESKLVRLD